MRVLAVCESPPTTDPVRGNGSTLISSRVLQHLPGDFEIDLLYFRDRDAEPDAQVLRRCRSVRVEKLRPDPAGWLAHSFTRMPRATWLRHVSRAQLRGLAEDHDVAYLHGLHVAPLGHALPVPTVVHLVDPWSEFWRELSRRSSPPASWYYAGQAVRAAGVERDVAGWAREIVVVNEQDARRSQERLGRPVVAIPNGIDPHGGSAPEATRRRQVCFVGTLDYPPNNEAIRVLVYDVWPALRQRVPDATLVIAGRRPPGWLERLKVPGVDVVGPVDQVSTVFAASCAAAYVGRTGRGTKNTVAEALAQGCPVVATSESARGQQPHLQLRIADTTAEIVDALQRLLAAEWTPSRPRSPEGTARPWEGVAQEYAELLAAAAANPVR